MNLIVEIFEILGIVAALIFGVKSWKSSNEANKIAKEANKLSERSLKISESMENETKENIRIKSKKSIMLLSSDDKNIKYSKGEVYSDLVCVIPLEITNLSSSPVTIKRPTFEWGKEQDYFYVADDDFVSINSYMDEEFENVNSFPIYLKPKETKNINVSIELDDSGRLLLYSSKGISLNFEATQSNYGIYISEKHILDLVERYNKSK